MSAPDPLAGCYTPVRPRPRQREQQDDAALTHHARERIRQRGYRERDVALVQRHGTRTREGFVLARRDADRAIAALRREIAHVERLRGSLVVVSPEDGAVLTILRPTDRQIGRMLRAGPL